MLKKCPSCEGKGKIIERPCHFSDQVEVMCPTCYGLGEVSTINSSGHKESLFENIFDDDSDMEC